MATNAQLTQQITDLLTLWNDREAQFRAWLSGTATGGPNSDGKYPLSNASGLTQLVDCPAKLSDTVGGPAGVSTAAQLLAEAARDAAISARDNVLTSETSVTNLHTQTIAARDLALLYRDDAASYAANASVARTATEAAWAAAALSETNASASEANALVSETNAAVSEAAAAASAILAATFDPSLFYLKTESDALYKPIGYVPDWSDLTNVPASFAPSTHTHGIADVTGLQSALDGKSSTSHTHSYLPLSGGSVTGTVTAGRLAVSATTYFDDNIGNGNPGLNFDANDFLDYDTTANKLSVYIGSSEKFSIASEVTVRTHIALDSGAADGANLIWRSAGYSDWNADNIAGRWRLYSGATERVSVNSDGRAVFGTGSAQSAWMSVYSGAYDAALWCESSDRYCIARFKDSTSSAAGGVSIGADGDGFYLMTGATLSTKLQVTAAGTVIANVGVQTPYIEIGSGNGKMRHASATNRSYIVPRNSGDTDWDWSKEFGFNHAINAWYFEYALHRASQGAFVHHGSTSHTSGKITVSTSAPSGGANGDIWFKV